MKKLSVIAMICLFPMLCCGCSTTKPVEPPKPLVKPIPNCIYSVVKWGDAVECMIIQHNALEIISKNNEI